jgi:transcription initiation factor TFIIE subunit alpha
MKKTKTKPKKSVPINKARTVKMPKALKVQKPRNTKNLQLMEEVVSELVGPEAVPIIMYLRGKRNVSEFVIAENVKEEIHRTRNILYRLLEHNIVSFKRKKDKVKGWYICYWDFNEQNLPYLKQKIVESKIERLRERLGKENTSQFYMCKNACVRMDFDKAVDFNFKCPECGEIMFEQDNKRTIEFIKERIRQLEATTA